MKTVETGQTKQGRLKVHAVWCLIALVILLIPAAAWGSICTARLDITEDLTPKGSVTLLTSADLLLSSVLRELNATDRLGTRAFSESWNASCGNGIEDRLRMPFRTKEKTPVSIDLPHDIGTASGRRISSLHSRASMLSYLFSAFFTDVDIYDELNSVRQRAMKRSSSGSDTKKEDRRTGWNINLSVKGAADVGVKVAYRNGELDVTVADISMDELASAKLEMRF